MLAARILKNVNYVPAHPELMLGICAWKIAKNIPTYQTKYDSVTRWTETDSGTWKEGDF